MVYTGSAEIGLGPAIQRHVGINRAQASPDSLVPILWTALLLYGIAGTILFLIGVLAAPWIVTIFGLSSQFHAEGIEMLRLVSLSIFVTLLAVGAHNTLQGLERFQATAVTASVSSIVFLISVSVAMNSGWGLAGLGVASILQATSLLLGRLWALKRLIFSARPRLLLRAEIRHMLSFSARLQVTAVTTLINTQTDKVVVGLVAGPTALGEIGIGAQIAESVRLVGAATIPPLVSRFAVAWAADDTEQVEKLAERAGKLVTIGAIGIGLIVTASLYPLVEAWLGPGHRQAAEFGVVLLLAYSFFLLCSPAISYLRAIGRARHEVLYGATATFVNIVATVSLGLTVGPLGVVMATLLAYVAGGTWFLRRAGRIAPVVRFRWRGVSRFIVVGLICGAVSYAFCFAMVNVLPYKVALVIDGLAVAAICAIYAGVTTGYRPSLARVRSWSRS
jgi:O-antigen/teichoic acid export membrane protein